MRHWSSKRLSELEFCATLARHCPTTMSAYTVAEIAISLIHRARMHGNIATRQCNIPEPRNGYWKDSYGRVERSIVRLIERCEGAIEAYEFSRDPRGHTVRIRFKGDDMGRMIGVPQD